MYVVMQIDLKYVFKFETKTVIKEEVWKLENAY